MRYRLFTSVGTLCFALVAGCASESEADSTITSSSSGGASSHGDGGAGGTLSTSSNGGHGGAVYGGGGDGGAGGASSTSSSGGHGGASSGGGGDGGAGATLSTGSGGSGGGASSSSASSSSGASSSSSSSSSSASSSSASSSSSSSSASSSSGGPDPNPGGCVSGATGTHVARFRWKGSGGTAYVGYDANNLPDPSRWKASAYSKGSIGYTPKFTDTGLGAGGLEMTSTVFMDVELSTKDMPSITHVTLSILGRSFNTSSPGSFSWQTFDGGGQAPNGYVSNSAPYEWYSVDATTAFAPNNAGVLLRISPVSTSLIVNSVEVCFETR